jgi:hypothetical protein
MLHLERAGDGQWRSKGLGDIRPLFGQAEKVDRRHHTDTPALRIHDRRAADVVPQQQARGVSQRHSFWNSNHIAGHQVVGCQAQQTFRFRRHGGSLGKSRVNMTKPRLRDYAGSKHCADKLGGGLWWICAAKKRRRRISCIYACFPTRQILQALSCP